jgi:hypothetical protein
MIDPNPRFFEQLSHGGALKLLSQEERISMEEFCAKKNEGDGRAYFS